MGATRDQEPLDCPFCLFSNYDHYELLIHVESMHPGSAGLSTDPHRKVGGKPGKGWAGTMDSSPPSIASKDAEFIECQCGEYCLIAECESHLEMHYAEGMSLNETQRSPSVSAALGCTVLYGEPSYPVIEGGLPNSGPDAALNVQNLVSSRSTAGQPSRNEGRKSQSLVQGFIDALRHSTAPPARNSTRVEPQKGPQRLGVSPVYEEKLRSCC